jgi:PAS domain-containing protein
MSANLTDADGFLDEVRAFFDNLDATQTGAVLVGVGVLIVLLALPRIAPRIPRIKLVVFMMLCSFAAFYFYLGRALRQLDPSRAVPARVRAALDTLAEGLLIIDLKGYIMLANQAFASVVGKTTEKLTGRLTSEFSWVTQAGIRLTQDEYPWARSLHDGTTDARASHPLTV